LEAESRGGQMGWVELRRRGEDRVIDREEGLVEGGEWR
jgi:hypothetical protein